MANKEYVLDNRKTELNEGIETASHLKNLFDVSVIDITQKMQYQKDYNAFVSSLLKEARSIYEKEENKS